MKEYGPAWYKEVSFRTGVSEQIASLAGITAAPPNGRWHEVNTKYGLVPQLQLERHVSVRTINRPTGVKNGEMYIRNAVLLPLNVHSILWRRPLFTEITKEKQGKQKGDLSQQQQRLRVCCCRQYHERLAKDMVLIRGSTNGGFPGHADIRSRRFNNNKNIFSNLFVSLFLVQQPPSAPGPPHSRCF